MNPSPLFAERKLGLDASVSLGRLVTSAEGQSEIFPVNFVVPRRTLLLRTAEGTKLVNAAANSQVLVEAATTMRTKDGVSC